METFGKFCFNILLIFLLALFGGFVMSNMWNWFVVYAIPTASPLGYVQAIGLSYFVGWIKITIKRDVTEKTTEEKIKDFGWAIIIGLATLGVGWIITLFQ